MGGKAVWKSCDKCKTEVKHIWTYKGESLCRKCYRKRVTVIGGPCPWARRKTLKEALDKVYDVKGYGYVRKDGSRCISAILNVPPVMIGRRIKLVLEEEESEENA